MGLAPCTFPCLHPRRYGRSFPSFKAAYTASRRRLRELREDLTGVVHRGERAAKLEALSSTCKAWSRMRFIRSGTFSNLNPRCG
ncbi:hypothetical protein KM043_017809 [Ampulex compressa]|nr:hypothetical protein KM043_017809 [Ampulex compressa]